MHVVCNHVFPLHYVSKSILFLYSLREKKMSIKCKNHQSFLWLSNSENSDDPETNELN